MFYLLNFEGDHPEIPLATYYTTHLALSKSESCTALGGFCWVSMVSIDLSGRS